jgi:hypothetical protein
MSEHDRLFDSELRKRVFEEVGLRRRRPHDISGPQAVAEAGSVKHDDSIVLGGEIDQSARLEILDHAAIAVEQHQGATGSSLHIVQANSVDLGELSLGRIVELRLLGKSPIDDRSRRHQRGCSDNCRRQRMFDESVKGRDRQRWRTFFQDAHVPQQEGAPDVPNPSACGTAGMCRSHGRTGTNRWGAD